MNFRYCTVQMPVVTRSDCTQTDVEETYSFYKDNETELFGEVTKSTVAFNSCQGANNKNNDLNAFVQQLVNDGKLTAEHKADFNTRVIGNKNCPAARDNLFEASGYEEDYVINDDRWTYIVGKFSSHICLT